MTPSPTGISIHRRSLDPVHSGVDGKPDDRSVGSPLRVNEIWSGSEIPEMEARIMPVGYRLSSVSEELKVISYEESVKFCHLDVSADP